MPGQRLSAGTIGLYAAPAFALAMPTIPVYVFLPTIYAEDLGLGLAATGIALLAARLFDVVTDPLVGYASDRYATRWGRRKPWIVVGAVLAAAGLWALFQPPDGIGAGYLAAWAVILYLGWTLVAVPYTAWGAELSDDYHQRARITGAREATMIVGVVVAGALPAVSAAAGGSERDGLTLAAGMAVAVGAVAVALLLWRVPEAPTVSQRRPAPLFDRAAWRAVIANGPFVRLLSAWFVNGLANGLPAVLFPLYVQYGLGVGPEIRGGLILAYFVAGVAAIPLWLRLSRQYGKNRVWCWAMVLACAAFVWVPLIPEGAVALFLVVCLVTGAALGADLALPPAMQADVIDLDVLRTGHHRAGLFFAMWSMATKPALACAVGIAFPALEAFGFETGGSNAPAAILALAVIYAVVPTVLKTGAIVLVWNHPITAGRQRAIRRRLDRRATTHQGIH